jgi:hypothetical protein
MQAEAGQPLELILRRKEVERAAGGGVFFWGIGTSVADKLKQMLGQVLQPKVLFSVMKAKPKPEDASPQAIYLWTSFVDLFGVKQLMPEHALVLSRAYTKRGPKTHHYALVCRSEDSLDCQPHGSLELAHFRNLGSNTPRIGASQVTAIIEHLPGFDDGPLYAVNLVADLIAPYFVRLCDPVPLSNIDKNAVDEIAKARVDPEEWMTFVRQLKRTAIAREMEQGHSEPPELPEDNRVGWLEAGERTHCNDLRLNF